MDVADFGMLFLLCVCLHVFLVAVSVLVATISLAVALLSINPLHCIGASRHSKDKATPAVSGWKSPALMFSLRPFYSGSPSLVLST